MDPNQPPAAESDTAPHPGQGTRSVQVATSVEELIAGATEREPLASEDSKSGAPLERVVIDGEPHVLKHLDLSVDWTLRTVGDLAGNTLALWTRGILGRLPECINQPIIGVAHEPGLPGGRSTWLLMRDVGPWLVPPGDDPIPLSQELSFLEHMAAVHATFWGAGPEIDLLPMMNRYLVLSPWMAETEAAIGSDAVVPKLVARGWPLLEEIAPDAASVVGPLCRDPSPLVDALGRMPTTLLHGNWKLGNLGTDDGGRTVLIDWEDPGRGPALTELAWYLAINAARLPHPKEAAIEVYRDALEHLGIDTEPWWDARLRLCLLGAIVQFGWEKALGGPGEELSWWVERVLDAAPLLDPAT